MITFFGDSHIRRLQRSMPESSQADEQSYSFHPAHGRQWFEFALNKTASGFKVEAPKVANWPALSLDLLPSGPLFFSSLFHTPAFLDKASRERYCPWQCSELANGRRVLSTATFEARFETQCQQRFDLLTLLKSQGFDVRALEAPKPPHKIPALFKMEPLEIRTIDGVLRRYIRKRLDQIGVPLVDAPASTHEEGFTLPEYSARADTDSHHGSDEFYRLQFAAATATAAMPE